VPGGPTAAPFEATQAAKLVVAAVWALIVSETRSFQLHWQLLSVGEPLDAVERVLGRVLRLQTSVYRQFAICTTSELLSIVTF
jgi:hypothetical protein